MGLFRKQPSVDPAEFDALRAELQDVRARLESAEQAKASLEARLGALDATASALTASTQARTAEIGGQLASLAERVRASESGASQLDLLLRRIGDVEARQSSLEVRPSSLAPPPPPPPDGQVEELAARVGELAERIAERIAEQAGLSERVTELDGRVTSGLDEARAARERVATLEQRIESIGTELANQLRELGREIDELAADRESTPDAPAPPPATTVTDEVIAALRTGQVRLANEQARYEIAFREDLATLAEQVRLLRGSR